MEALNQKHRLPKYILVIPECDVLKHITWGSGVSILIGAALHYAIKHIDQYIDRRRSLLRERKPGALLSEEFPKIIWVRMLQRYGNTANEGIFALRGHFNSILEDRLMEGNVENHYIMSLEAQPNDFDCTGFLTAVGKSSF